MADLTPSELRSAWYHRLHRLWPWLARPGVRTALRGLGWSLFALYLVFTVLVLVLRYQVLPQVQRYQGEIEAAASQALGLPVRIGHLEARWRGLNPALVLDDVRLLDAQDNPALTLTRVEGVLSWRSVLVGQPVFSLLSLERPALQIRRAPDGEIFVAGISTAGPGDGKGLAWLLEQSRIRITNATIAWEDESRGAPPLILEDLQFELDNWGSRHRFGVTALPPATLASSLDLRGELHGRAEQPLDQWEGQVYTRLDYADLAAWGAWVDYPVSLPRGRGGVRLWLGRDDGAWEGVADLALRDLRLRLEPQLPELDLTRLEGRIALTQGPGRLQLNTRQLQLETRDGLHLSPLDLAADWRGQAGQPGQGSIKANQFDLQVLAGLAAYLPLDTTSRELLARQQPQGRIRQLQASWDARDGSWNKYSLKTAFEGLGLKAHQVLPGAQGLAGELEANQDGGSLQLDARKSSLDLPAIFAEPEIPLDRLVAQVDWSQVGRGDDAGMEVRIQRLDFSGPYAAGQVSGTYRTEPDGPGVIDLQGGISQAKATEVWRFIPKVVNPDVPAWLKQGLLAGAGTDAHLVLKGNLKDFPFRDPALGQFLITAKAKNVTIHYGRDWPVIEGVEADMSFGVGMQIRAHSGHILGAKLGETTADLPDFDVMDELLMVRGKASGETAEFFKFIDRSPVAATINHFTEGMSASGHGRLDLDLELPLRRIDDAKIKGRYTFEGNQIGFVPGLPPATGVQGVLDFTEKMVNAPDVRGSFLGLPMELKATSEPGVVNIKATGGFTSQALRRHFGLPLFDQISGSSSWQADVKVRGKNADFLVTSSLQGLSSSLPQPFNKSAGEAMPWRLEKSTLAGSNPARESVTLSLGKVLEGQLVRRLQNGKSVMERGVIGIGQSVQMPDKGLNVFITQDKLDLDQWQRLFDKGLDKEPASAQGVAAASTFPVDLVAVQSQELTALGRSFGEVSLRLRPDGNRWRVMVAAKEAVGEFSWDGSGQGMVTADLKRLHLPSGQSQEPDTGLLQSLPSMDIKVGDFTIGPRRLGRVELKAENAGGGWNLRQILVDNPDGRLTGNGLWVTGNTNRTQLDFDMKVNDSGGLLGRLGYPGAIKGGTAALKGKLAWHGAPTAFDPATLGGTLELEAAKGQFSKVDPGVGKLLGLLSLQSVTRRLTLDFRDIFSDGFAYDSIVGRMKVDNGLMTTEGNLTIDGPAGEVLMNGTVDLKGETQNLLVTIQPELGGVAAVGAAVAINPVVGAAALVAQNLLKNPLNKAFGFRYKVTGSWNEPVVEKVSGEESAKPEAAKENGAK